MFGRFATRKHEAQYPRFFEGLGGAWCPSVTGPTGLSLYNLQGRNNTGTLTNMDAPTDWVRSAGQYAIDFDGVNDFVSIPRIAAYDSTRWRTLSAWVNARTFDGQFGFNDILGCDFIGGTREWVASTATDATLTDARFSFGVFGTGGGAVSAETPEIILANEWTHLCVTQDGSYTFGGFAAYINGRPQTLTNTSSGTFTAPSVGTNALHIGRRVGNGGFDLHWNGLIDDCAIWTRRLTAGEAMQLYRLGRGGMFRLRRDIVFGSTANRRRRLLTGMV